MYCLYHITMRRYAPEQQENQRHMESDHTNMNGRADTENVIPNRQKVTYTQCSQAH